MSYVPPSWGGSEPPPPPPSSSGWRKPPIERSVLLVVAVFGVIGVLAWFAGRLDARTLVAFGVLIPAIILHEVSHGWVALMFGDHTAQRAGRLTLNPLRHIDPVGTFILPAVLLLSGANAIGYAKPVPVNVSQMSPNKSLMVSLAGPLTNIVLAVLAAVFLRFAAEPILSSGGSAEVVQWTLFAIFAFGLGNVHLAVFNLIPIPPLDGSAIIERFLPRKYLPQYLQLRQYAMIILIVVFLVGFQYISGIFDPFDNLWIQLSGFGWLLEA